MDVVPEYLPRSLDTAVVGLGTFAVERNEEAVVEAARTVTDALGQWEGDEDFWSSAEANWEPASFSESDSGDMLDSELDIMAEALEGHVPLALQVVLETAPAVDTEPPPGDSVGRAREVVAATAREGEAIVAAPPGRSRAWRAARFLKKSITVVGGGLAIAADIVTPDPTGITKVASVVGGVAAIASVLPD